MTENDVFTTYGNTKIPKVTQRQVTFLVRFRKESL